MALVSVGPLSIARAASGCVNQSLDSSKLFAVTSVGLFLLGDCKSEAFRMVHRHSTTSRGGGQEGDC